MMSRTLLSRPNLEKLARITDQDLKVTTELEKEQLIDRLRSAISIGGTRGNASLYRISVRNRDRELARRTTQALITVFIESSLAEKRDDSTGAQSFIDEQIAGNEVRLIEAEDRLARFKQQNVGVLPGASGGDYYSRLEQTREALRQARLELEEMENRRDELKRQLAGEKPLEGSQFASPLDSRIEALQLRLDALLARYTEQHPEVRQILGLIDELEKRKEESASSMDETVAPAAGLSENPVYQGMRAMLAEAEAGVAELRVRVQEYERRSSDLNAKVNQIPEVEAQLKQLNRDYNVIYERHQQLLQRRESARLSQDVEDNASDVSFRVIDPPYVPSTPNDPNKLLLNAGVLVLSLGVGVGVALLLSLLKP